jgi:hypothetical protein
MDRYCAHRCPRLQKGAHVMSRLAANSLRARDRRARRMLAKKVGALSNKRIIVNVGPVFEALLDPRIARNLGELLALSSPTAEGRLKLDTWTGKDGKERTGIMVAAWRVEQLGQIGKNKPAKPKAPPEGEQPAPPSTVPERDWQKPASAFDEIPF